MLSALGSPKPAANQSVFALVDRAGSLLATVEAKSPEMLAALAALSRAIQTRGHPDALSAAAAALEPVLAALPAASQTPAPADLGAASSAQHDAELASWYLDRARKLRARAARPETSADQRSEYEKRGEWYEARAAIKRAGGFMPRELRTPLESAQGADFFRRTLAELLDGVVDLDGPEVGMFAGALATHDRSTVVTQVAWLFNSWRGATMQLLEALGAARSGANAPAAPAQPPWTFATADRHKIAETAAVAGRSRDEDDREIDETPERPTVSAVGPASAVPRPKVIHIAKPEAAAVAAGAHDTTAPPATSAADATTE
jgi:hypothetical protein